MVGGRIPVDLFNSLKYRNGVKSKNTGLMLSQAQNNTLIISVSDPGLFVQIRKGLFFLRPDSERQKIRILIQKIRVRIHEKTP